MDLGLSQNFLTESQRQAAIAYLLTQLEPDTLLSLHDFIHTAEWPVHWHFGFGTHVRNLLRGKYHWDDQLLDAEWVPLVEHAVREYVETNPPEATE